MRPPTVYLIICGGGLVDAVLVDSPAGMDLVHTRAAAVRGVVVTVPVLKDYR